MLLLFAFLPQFGLEGIWVSVFTAISAFCNAGFDLFGRFGQYSSGLLYTSIRHRNDHQATPQREKSFGLMEFFFILLSQLRRERHKIFLSQPCLLYTSRCV